MQISVCKSQYANLSMQISVCKYQYANEQHKHIRNNVDFACNELIGTSKSITLSRYL